MDFRSFFKPAGTNPEIEGPYYELSSFALIVGHSNFKALTLGFEKGSSVTKMTFVPIDPTKPIVLAVDDMSSIGFIYIDHHLEEGAEAGMRNYSIFMTNDFIIDCQHRDISRSDGKYWSITSEGQSFVYGERNFPGTWKIDDCDQLCAFVAGDLTANQLRMNAFLQNREAVKEDCREERIRIMRSNLGHAFRETREAKQSLGKYASASSRLMRRIRNLTTGWWPLVTKKEVQSIIDEYSKGSGQVSN